MKDLNFVGSSRENIRVFPEEVKDNLGYALRQAQNGEKPSSAKPLKGFGGASVLEIIENFRKDTYRAVYTVSFKDAVYVRTVFKRSQNMALKLRSKI